MTIPDHINDRVKRSYREDALLPGETRQAVDVGGLLSGVNYDTVSAAYPDSVTEVYSFKSGGLAGTLLATITVVYTSSTKEVFSSAVRT